MLCFVVTMLTERRFVVGRCGTPRPLVGAESRAERKAGENVQIEKQRHYCVVWLQNGLWRRQNDRILPHLRQRHGAQEIRAQIPIDPRRLCRKGGIVGQTAQREEESSEKIARHCQSKESVKPAVKSLDRFQTCFLASIYNNCNFALSGGGPALSACCSASGPMNGNCHMMPVRAPVYA